MSLLIALDGAKERRHGNWLILIWFSAFARLDLVGAGS